MADASTEKRVRELRTASEWSQGELANELGVSRQTINSEVAQSLLIISPELSGADQIAEVNGF